MWTYACARVHIHAHVSVAMTEHREQRHLEEDRVHCRLQLSGHSPTLKEVRAGAQAGAEAMEGPCWFSWLACSSCSLIVPRITCLAEPPSTVSWAPLHHQPGCPTGQSCESSLVTVVSSSSVNLAGVKLT